MRDLTEVKYNRKEIVDVAKRMHDNYGMIFVNRFVPVHSMKNLARLLEEYSQTEEQRLFVLEYAARIKYEILLNTDYFSVETCKNPMYFDFKNSAFASSKAASDIYGLDQEVEMPELIEKSVDHAYYESVKFFGKKDNKLVLKSISK